jgi:predicted transcriptional regulator
MVMLTYSQFVQLRGVRRDKLVIMSVILSYATKGLGKTELMYKVGLSSAQLEKYIPALVKSGLLEVSSHANRAFYKTTDKGRSFVDVFDTLVGLLDL